jgi:hypothetical protein
LRGNDRLENGEFDEDRNTALIRLDLNNVRAYLNRGSSCTEAEFGKAIADFSEAIRIDLAAQGVLIRKGTREARARSGDCGLHEALKIDPNDNLRLLWLVHQLQQQGRRRRAAGNQTGPATDSR